MAHGKSDTLIESTREKGHGEGDSDKQIPF
jgi:hypothetical protein